MTRKILDFGAKKIDLPSGLPESVPYLYFQAPGGQCFQLLPIDEDQSYYKKAGDGPNLAKEKEAEALKEKAMSELAKASPENIYEPTDGTDTLRNRGLYESKLPWTVLRSIWSLFPKPVPSMPELSVKENA
jgi:hypothetical protein